MFVRIKVRPGNGTLKIPLQSDHADRSRPCNGFIYSLVLHGMALIALAFAPIAHVRAPQSAPAVAKLSPREIRIGDRLYFVTKLPPLVDPEPRNSPRSASTQARQRTARRKPLSSAAAQTLIQPDSPGPAILDAPLPSFEIRADNVTPPGPPESAGASRPESPSRVVDQDSAPADPAVLSPKTSSENSETAPHANAAALERIGERANIYSANPQPVELPSRLLVPPGNAIPGDEEANPKNAEGLAGNPSVSEPLGQEHKPDRGSASDVSARALSTEPGPSGVPGVASLPADHGQPGLRVLERSPTGSFDAVIVQSSPAPLRDGSLLRGRPLYTVYIAVGTKKDWVLYFCLPSEPSGVRGPVVQIASVPVVRPPWPTHLVIPQIAPPPGEKSIAVHGSIGASGNFEDLKIVQPVAGVDEQLLNSLAAWRFRPATKDGVPIAVEAILSIPLARM